MTTPRKHAELIKAWADDSEMQIEMLTDDNRWIMATPDWEPDIEYRIKPKKLRIGNIEIEAPETKALQAGEVFYIPYLFDNNKFETFVWYDSKKDYELLKRNIVHKTTKNAIAHTDALIAISNVD